MSTDQRKNSLLARNSLLNFGGQIIPLIVGIFAIPIVIHGLGAESFGILSLAWMLIGYFTVFDLGMGRATTKFVSEEIRNGSPEDIRNVFWTSSWMNFFLGVIGGIGLASVSSILAERVFKISPALMQVAGNAFMILAISCPIVLVSTAFRGTLEAAQRFDYVNSVVVVSSSLNFLLPMIGVFAGLNVQGIVFLLMIARLGSTIAYFLLCVKVFPELKKNISIDMDRIRRLLRYGGWVSVSNIINPVLTYLDRFLIGSMVSIAAVAYYTAPYEMVSRMSILPASLAMTLFPSFSAVNSAEHGSMATLYSRSTKFLLFLIGPLVAVLIFFAGDILRLWLGSQFAETSTVVLQVFTVGILMNSLAQIPYALIQGFGRPDITAKFHFLELIIYIPLVWFFVKNFGIVGGAFAWTFRVTLDSLLLFNASLKFVNFRTVFEVRLQRCISFVFLMMLILFGLSFWNGIIFPKIIICGGIVILFGIASWLYVLDIKEKELIGLTVREFVGNSRKP